MLEKKKGSSHNSEINVSTNYLYSTMNLLRSLFLLPFLFQMAASHSPEIKRAKSNLAKLAAKSAADSKRKLDAKIAALEEAALREREEKAALTSGSPIPYLDDLAEAVGVDPFTLTVVLTAIFGLIIMMLLTSSSGSSSRRRRRRTGKTVLILGHMGSGKTVLLHRLAHGTCPSTVTSMKVNEKRVSIEGVDKSSVHLVDVPGHPRARGDCVRFFDQTAAIVFVVDSTTASLQASAEYLAELLTNRTVDELQPPILVACNKCGLRGWVS